MLSHDYANSIVLKGVTLLEPGDQGLCANAIGKTPQAWDGRAIFSSNKMPIFMSDWDRYYLGKCFNARMEGNKLLTDLYLDPHRLEMTRHGLAAKIRNNEGALRIIPHFGKSGRSITPLCILVPEFRVNENTAYAENPPKILLDQEKRIVLYDHVLAKVGDEGLTRLDLKRYPGAWNGKNIFYGLSGPPVDPKQWTNKSIGRVFRTTFRNDKLTAEVHFDPVALSKIHTQLPDLIRSGAIKPKVKLYYGSPQGATTATPYCLLMQAVNLPRVNRSDGPPSVLMNPGGPDPSRKEKGVPESPSILLKRTKQSPQRLNKHGIEDMPPVLTSNRR